MAQVAGNSVSAFVMGEELSLAEGSYTHVHNRDLYPGKEPVIGRALCVCVCVCVCVCGLWVGGKREECGWV